MENSRRLPEFDRLSVLIATILLAYVTARIVDLPSRIISINFGGIFLPIQLTANTLITLIVAGMTASGMDWLLRGHPGMEEKSTTEHWIFPALTAWILSVPLSNLPFIPVWWGIFSAAGIILLIVFSAEYIVADPTDSRHPAAAAGLIALSFALFLILVVSIRSIGFRLLLLLPSIGFAAGFVSLRAIHLRNPDRWHYSQAATTTLIVTQLSAALHYLPVSPISFGLTLLGPIYAISNYYGNKASNSSQSRGLYDPIIILITLWVLAIIFR